MLMLTKAQPKRFDVTDLTPSKISDMQLYAAALQKKFPHFKKERLKRKVAEYFKVKLV
jgi:hypothetical protein